MYITEIQKALKDLSDEELAAVGSAIVCAPGVDTLERTLGMELIASEAQLRKTEGLGRKAARFWNRHGESVTRTAASLTLGALLGDWLGD